ncbi:MAG: polyamine aminopropyltransferase [Acidobacteria bacterium]|nr:polyamine aminopropyltransferase [Acidobacteriota bacterium]
MKPSSGLAGAAARLILLASVFVVAACGLVYELVAGAVSSYLMGDAVTQFSLVIGVFLCAMGLGSYLAKYVRRELLRIFIEIEIWLGLVGGLSSMAMFTVSAFFESVFAVFFYGLCALLGVLVGVEIPLLVRIFKEVEDVSAALSNVLALDYVGALAGSVLFPLVVLPYLGLSRASVVFGLMNLGVAAAGLTLLRDRRRFWIAARLALSLAVLVAALVWSTALVGFLEDYLYQDDIVYAARSQYQRIVLTRWRDDIRLFLNGHLQFCSLDEARYHEALVMPALEACPRARDVLILGGGDGLAAREVLKYEQVRRIVLVDIDPLMTRLGRTRRELVHLNGGALNSAKVRIRNEDAFKFLEQDRGFYDVILADLPDPSSETLAKLYSRSFYALCLRRLRPAGVLATQATSPFYARQAFWCIERTMAAALDGGPPVEPPRRTFTYLVNVPSFGEWGFVMAAPATVDPRQLAPRVPTRYLTADVLPAMFAFGRDVAPPADMGVNRLDHPLLYQYYRQGWQQYNE